MSLRLISFLILLGIMPVSSVYAQKDCAHEYENGICNYCNDYKEPEKGNGDVNTPFQIANAGNLYWFAETVNSSEDATYANAILTADIVVQHVFNEYGNLNNANFRVWTPIGDDDDVSDDYHGTFDGQGHTISGLYCYGGEEDVYIGLFGVIGPGGTVKNLGIKDSYFNGEYSPRYVGGIAGWNNEGTVTNCYVTISELVGSDVGGIVSTNDGTITNCYSTVYGIAGDDVNNGVTNCYYLEGTATEYNSSYGTSRTAAQFDSGEVAYLLQGEQGNQVWGQNIDNDGERQYYPVFSDAKVFRVIGCNDYVVTYSNTDKAQGDHVYDNGFCVCGAYQQPEQDNNVYQIANAGNLYWFAALVNGVAKVIGQTAQNTSANAKLTDDITVNDGVLVGGELNSNHSSFRLWTPIGSSSNNYSGTFDGDNHTISGLYCNNYDSSVGGLFGYVDIGGQNNDVIIKNLGVIDSYISGSPYAGGIVAMINGVYISNCYNTATVTASDYAGGIVGYVEEGRGDVTNCYSVGKITNNSGDDVGGIVGCNSNGVSNNCYYLKGTANNNGGGISKSSEEFASGEVAYLLQGEQGNQIWGQNIDNGHEVQLYPVFSNAKVHQVKTSCDAHVTAAYSNIENTSVDHAYVNGICPCGAYQPATDSDEDGYYEIANAGNLYWFAEYVNAGNTSANAKLTADITVNDGYTINSDGTVTKDDKTYTYGSEEFPDDFKTWTPIGSESKIYSGIFDGDNHTISGLYFNNSNSNSNANYVGLFGNCNKANIYNLGLIDSYFCADYYVGGIVGCSSNSTVSNCYNAGSVTGKRNVGGIVGIFYGNTISNCYNTGTITSTDTSSVGGIVGYVGSVGNSTGTVSNCYNTGYVTCTYNSTIGGIVGGIPHGSPDPTSKCYYLKGTVTGNNVSANSYGISKSSEEFASGEVAYLLQDSQETQVWGQNIDNGQEVQFYPVFSDARVYLEDILYTNNNTTGTAFWSYKDNTLTIYGSGNMRDFTDGETKPWSNYLSEINTVVVKAGITGIGDNAFSDVKDGTTFFFYNSTAITFREGSIKTSSTVYVPDLWNVNNVAGVNVTKMPTYTSTGWLGDLSNSSHVVINSALVLGQQSKANSNVLTVKSFGLTENGSLTIQDGGQLICQQANGEVTVEKEIQSYSQEPRAKSQSSTKWYTISSPLKGNVAATSITSLIDEATPGNYALYRYDEPTHYWQNYKLSTNNFTTLDAGRGYLYARSNSEVTTLQFKGEINTGSVEYVLTAKGEHLNGIHLVGNPFTHNITFSNLSSTTTLASGYYVLSNQGAWTTNPSTDGDIKPGQGILIKTTAAGTLTINPTQPTAKGQQPRANSQQPMLSLNVSNGNYSDRAFVIFGKGVGLDKINHQNEEIPMLYIPMSDADYAIAMMDESVNEIPVGFESSSMGQFTITLKQENCEFEELYLLDKETGAKVNILEEGYTFMATSGDNAERFTLIKSQGSQPEAQSNFAYISNNDIVIYDVEGNAHIDIYDVLGRRVYNNNGSDDVHIVNTDGYSAGVYVIRIMDENGLRTQKVVIE